MIETRLGLEARENLAFVIAHWGELGPKLLPGSSSEASRMPSGEPAGVPLNLHVSDLIHEITSDAQGYAVILVQESVGFELGSLQMPAVLQQVIDHYGHFVCDEDEKVAIDFCDWAHEIRRKVEQVLDGPEARVYLGWCRTDDCEGEIHARESVRSGRCPECGEPWTMDGQREFLADALRNRLMTTGEIVEGLKVAGVEVPRNTLRQWVKRKRIVAVVDEGEECRLYSFADAYALACRSA